MERKLTKSVMCTIRIKEEDVARLERARERVINGKKATLTAILLKGVDVVNGSTV